MLKRHERRKEDDEFRTPFAVLAVRQVQTFPRQMFLVSVADYKTRKQTICVTPNDTSVQHSEGHILYNDVLRRLWFILI